MTAQIPDEFHYEGEEYSLVGMKGSGLFTPEDFGLRPRMASTACWRGYVMKYDCINGQLVLSGMLVNSEQGPPINGVEPVEGPERKSSSQVMAQTTFVARMFTYRYESLKLKTNFTGSLLLAKDFIDSMYVHMGFQRPFAYRTVLEIQVQDGDIISVCDVSSKMEELRLMGSQRGSRPQSDEEKDVRAWIEDMFSLDYNL